jgi:sulfate adenylyltransferase subunit 1
MTTPLIATLDDRTLSTDPARGAGGAGGLLRLATAGSVDDGKSTLVGRLLHDSKAVFADQLESVRASSQRRGLTETDLALLTDGLRAEREQGITIDVAYRYFATAKRRFVLADTPGHVQYTRNMVTGASPAQLAVILADARAGVLEQTRRHAAIAALLRVPHVVLAVNKMDLVDFAEDRFEAVAGAFAELTKLLGIADATAIPVSALRGDNVVSPSARMDWYGGPTLLEHLETVPTADDLLDAPARLPVQYVIRHQTHGEDDRTGTSSGYRGYAGQLASGRLSVGDEIAVVGASGAPRHTRVAGIDLLGAPVKTAVAGQSIALRLTDQLDVARGDTIAVAARPPQLTQDLVATACHLADKPLRAGDRVLVKHGTRVVRGLIRSVGAALDVSSLRHTPRERAELTANDIAGVEVRVAEPLPVDDYAANRITGSFLLIDETDGATLAAGMLGNTPWAAADVEGHGSDGAADGVAA